MARSSNDPFGPSHSSSLSLRIREKWYLIEGQPVKRHYSPVEKDEDGNPLPPGPLATYQKVFVDPTTITRSMMQSFMLELGFRMTDFDVCASGVQVDEVEGPMLYISLRMFEACITKMKDTSTGGILFRFPWDVLAKERLLPFGHIMIGRLSVKGVDTDEKLNQIRNDLHRIMDSECDDIMKKLRRLYIQPGQLKAIELESSEIARTCPVLGENALELSPATVLTFQDPLFKALSDELIDRGVTGMTRKVNTEKIARSGLGPREFMEKVLLPIRVPFRIRMEPEEYRPTRWENMFAEFECPEAYPSKRLCISWF